MHILLLDNYDSFTFNVVELLRQCGVERLTIEKNDEVNLSDLSHYTHILLSPGPATPQESGQLIPLIQQYYTSKPILGICLGHQAIAVALGGSLQNMTAPKHGYRSTLLHKDHDPLFHRIPQACTIGLYHSWVVDEADFPKELDITARSSDGYIMALKHRALPLHGVQFHPESYMTEHGKTMVQNFLKSRL